MARAGRVPSIAVNLLCLRIDHPMGVERYVRNVIGAMPLPADADVCLFMRRQVSIASALGTPGVQAGRADPPALRDRLRTEVKRLPTGSTFTRILVEMFVLSLALWRRDRVLSINNFGPLAGKRGQKRFVFIHDVWFLSEHYEGGTWRRIAYSMLIRIQVRTSHHVFTLTDFSKHEIHRLLGVPLSRITVVPVCLGRVPRSNPLPSGDYFLLVGSSRPNKNVLRAIEAFRSYREHGGTRRLVVAGEYADAYVRRMKTIAGVDAGAVLEIVGFASEAQLQDLMARCTGLVFVSLYEGYGIPVLESLLQGKPALVSRGTSCEEVLQGLGVVVDGTSVEDITRGLEALESFDTGAIVRRLGEIRDRAFDCRRIALSISDVLLA